MTDIKKSHGAELVRLGAVQDHPTPCPVCGLPCAPSVGPWLVTNADRAICLSCIEGDPALSRDFHAARENDADLAVEVIQ